MKLPYSIAIPEQYMLHAVTAGLLGGLRVEVVEEGEVFCTGVL